ncbi:MAG: alanine--tRNA ligase [Patescibacteria group bacterium]
MTAKELRQRYLDFFKNRGHAIIPSASLIPSEDSSTLFTGSGMQPLVPYLLGEKHPEGVRLCDSQKCFRAEDIEEIGDNRHNTFFEMLGNWSLGDYFKKEQLNWFFEFLTKELQLDPSRLYVSVFGGNEDIGVPRDEESVDIWKDIFSRHGIEAQVAEESEVERNGMGQARIFYYSEAKNWWSRSGKPADMPVGEIGGPDSEVFYDLGEELGRHENSPWKNQPCHINCDCGRFIEIGNSVFIEYIKTEQGFEKLNQKNVDFGGGLERISMIMQGKTNVYETDLFQNTLDKISKLSGGKKYQDNMKAFEVIADHLKAATFIMGDDKGIKPSNTDQGYIVRRLLRRAVRYGRQIGIDSGEPWIPEMVKIITDDYKEAYPELARNRDFIVEGTKEEQVKFEKTLNKGLKEFKRIIDSKKEEDKILNGVEAFDLYQTYGFPIEITEELAEERGFKVDEKDFAEQMKKHQELSRTASAGKFKGGLADSDEETKKLHTAAHLLLAALRQVLGAHVTQKGSNITSERLRFDFSHPEKLTEEQKQEVERSVNEAIEKDLPVACEEMPLEQAKNNGAVASFEERYGEQVKVYKIGEGEDNFSYEICGGPHVDRTGGLGYFRIKKEESSSAGVRRIKAVLENK